MNEPGSETTDTTSDLPTIDTTLLLHEMPISAWPEYSPEILAEALRLLSPACPELDETVLAVILKDLEIESWPPDDTLLCQLTDLLLDGEPTVCQPLAKRAIAETPHRRAPSLRLQKQDAGLAASLELGEELATLGKTLHSTQGKGHSTEEELADAPEENVTRAPTPTDRVACLLLQAFSLVGLKSCSGQALDNPADPGTLLLILWNKQLCPGRLGFPGLNAPDENGEMNLEGWLSIARLRPKNGQVMILVQFYGRMEYQWVPPHSTISLYDIEAPPGRPIQASSIIQDEILRGVGTYALDYGLASRPDFLRVNLRGAPSARRIKAAQQALFQVSRDEPPGSWIPEELTPLAACIWNMGTGPVDPLDLSAATAVSLEPTNFRCLGHTHPRESSPVHIQVTDNEECARMTSIPSPDQDRLSRKRGRGAKRGAYKKKKPCLRTTQHLQKTTFPTLTWQTWQRFVRAPRRSRSTTQRRPPIMMSSPDTNPVWPPFRGGSDYYYDAKLGRHLRWNDPPAPGAA